MKEQYSMVQELTDHFLVEKPDNGKFKIHIEAPEKYRFLWMSKLSDLRTTMEEIKEMEKDE
ncbi:hypothetical protein [Candidatus Neptunichlamydia sp. REUL1]|uniref:hypothetical protein n=1 Tax=Candidatus Neptunichlamydia sp. REUL1 TaxID=3064277 RepID=UPI00292EE213|nr:hypothetical protein [Candidatus Neptunochlamydia sp. REUL1]